MPVLQKVLLAVLVGTAPLLAADFRLAAPVSDHMVLQRDKPVAVWGFGDAEEEIDVAFGGQNKQAVADAEGRWSVRLDAMPASTEPRTLVAVGTVYDRTVPAISGPLPAGHAVDGSSITIDFRHAAGLKARDGGPLRGFVIAGADRVWKTAAARITRISGETVVVSSPEVPAPVAVRYAWAENPDGNLINVAGLPATTFRTDDWPAAK